MSSILVHCGNTSGRHLSSRRVHVRLCCVSKRPGLRGPSAVRTGLPFWRERRLILRGCASPRTAPSPPTTQSSDATASARHSPTTMSSPPLISSPSVHLRSPPPSPAKSSPRHAPLRAFAATHGMEPSLPSQQSDFSSSWQLGWGSTLFAGLLLVLVGILRLRSLRFASTSRGRRVPSSAITSRSRLQDVELETMDGYAAATNARLNKACEKFSRLEDETHVATAELSVRVRSVVCFFFSFLLFGLGSRASPGAERCYDRQFPPPAS